MAIDSSPPPAAQSSPPDLATCFRELQRLLIATPELDAFLAEVAALAVEVIAAVSSCAVTLRRDGKPMTVTASGPLADRTGELQYGRGAGPCRQALHTGQIVIVTDLAVESRWGDYPARALSRGIAASLSLPLMAEKQTVGTLSLYSGTAHEFTPAEVSNGASFAAQASGAMTLAQRHEAQLKVNAQLLDALGSRTIIDQAMGVLMGRQHISATEAFDALRSQSQHRNVKLHTVAADVVRITTRHAAQAAPIFSQRS